MTYMTHHLLLCDSYAEMPKDTKNTISHRKRALEKLRTYIEDNLHLLAAAEGEQLAGEKKSRVDTTEDQADKPAQ